MVSHMSMSDSESPQDSWTLLSILADLNNAVVWMFSALISKSFSSFPNTLGIVPSAPTTFMIGQSLSTQLLCQLEWSSSAIFEYPASN